MSPIVTIRPMIYNASKSKFITHFILKYERKVEKEYDKIDLPKYLGSTEDSILFIQSTIDLPKYLGSTEDSILFIQSTDDPMVPYETSLKVAEETHNPHIQTIKFNNRKHNPNYTESAISYMNEVFGAFTRQLNDKKISNDEERIAYFKDVSIDRLTEQDDKLFAQIQHFIDE